MVCIGLAQKEDLVCDDIEVGGRLKGVEAIHDLADGCVGKILLSRNVVEVEWISGSPDGPTEGVELGLKECDLLHCETLDL